MSISDLTMNITVHKPRDITVPEDFLKRKGIIKVNEELLHKSYGAIPAALKDVLVIGVEAPFLGTRELYGYSTLFDPVPPAEKPPHYRPTITAHQNDAGDIDQYDVKWEKMND